MSDNKAKRHVVSLNLTAAPMIQQIQKAMQNGMPPHLREMKISQALAVETALKRYIENIKE